jgi:hypothetical protein
VIVLAKKQRPKGAGAHLTTRQCSTPGCHHSAAFDLVFLGTEYEAVCTSCKNEAEKAWDHALFGWPDEAAA